MPSKTASTLPSGRFTGRGLSDRAGHVHHVRTIEGRLQRVLPTIAQQNKDLPHWDPDALPQTARY